MKSPIDSGIIITILAGVIIGVGLLAIIDKTGAPVPTLVGPVGLSPSVVNPLPSPFEDWSVTKPPVTPGEIFNDSKSNWN